MSDLANLVLDTSEDALFFSFLSLPPSHYGHCVRLEQRLRRGARRFDSSRDIARDQERKRSIFPRPHREVLPDDADRSSKVSCLRDIPMSLTAVQSVSMSGHDNIVWEYCCSDASNATSTIFTIFVSEESSLFPEARSTDQRSVWFRLAFWNIRRRKKRITCRFISSDLACLALPARTKQGRSPIGVLFSLSVVLCDNDNMSPEIGNEIELVLFFFFFSFFFVVFLFLQQI